MTRPFWVSVGILGIAVWVLAAHTIGETIGGRQSELVGFAVALLAGLVRVPPAIGPGSRATRRTAGHLVSGRWGRVAPVRVGAPVLPGLPGDGARPPGGRRGGAGCPEWTASAGREHPGELSGIGRGDRVRVRAGGHWRDGQRCTGGGVRDRAGSGRQHPGEGSTRGWHGQIRNRLCAWPGQLICLVCLTALRLGWLRSRPGR